LIASSTGQVPAWANMPVRFWISDRGSPQIGNGSEFAAVQAAFQTWQNVPTATVSFQAMGPTPVSTVGQDRLNTVTFVDNTVPLGSDTIASTFSFFELGSDGNLVIQEADIALNPAVGFSTSGNPGKYDVQGVVTHEVGHLLGLDHSALLSSVMTPYGAAGQLDQRMLTYDDMVGISVLYPNSSAIASLGAISGTILAGPTPVFGAHVVAVDVNGTPLVSTLSQPDGSYEIDLLPAGSYRVYAEPLDGPVTEQNIGGTPSSFFHNLPLGFGTTFSGNVPDLATAFAIPVTTGQLSDRADIQVLPATTLNLTEPQTFAVRIPLGSQATLRIGGTNIESGDTVSVPASNVSSGNPTYAGSIGSSAPSSATITLSVGSNAAVGPKDIQVLRGGAASVLSGGMVIVNPQPSNIRISPSSGPVDGGTVTMISGQNFRAGAQVYLDGLAASDVQVLSATSIRATTPADIPEVANVVVVNTDGTSGVQAGAFTYIPQLPVITSASPLAGPPTTVVTLLGSELNAPIASLDVRFNGAPASIVGATSTRIDAMVPYGATTGPITVNILGQRAAGPAFTVTPVPTGSNFALSSRPFVDATPAAGGTAISFGNTDDASAIVTLPFTFALFNKPYPAGSTVGVATNGWLSLDAFTAPEYQNGSLPGSIPPALIAPFFDDLFFRTGGGVSSVTLGAAPNRQFVVEWSNAGILDDQGNDTGAKITFEAIFYEGTNDIQFVYGSMTGPRSDGSSATIGIQDTTRTLAVQSGFNQGIAASGSVIVYHFTNGTYGSPAAPTTRQYSIVNRGGFSATTDGSGNGPVVGYATVSPDSGNTTPYGVAIFGYRVSNVLVSEAGVPASPVLQNGRIYAEVSGPVETGIAIANPNAQAATISFFFTNNAGADFGAGTAVIPANGQISKFLDQAPFNGGPDIHGTFTFNSNVPVSVIAIRGLTNERNEFLFSTLPVSEISGAIGTSTVVLPHFADGGGWTTQVILVNPGDSTIAGNIQFMNTTGQQTQAPFPFSIPGRSSFKLATGGTGTSVQTGSVQVVPNAGNGVPASIAIFSFKPGRVTVSEAAVGSASGTAIRMYVEASGLPNAIGAIQSGLAAANSSSNPVTVEFDLTGLDGSALANASLTIPANGQVSKFLNEIFPSVSLPPRAVLRITTPGVQVSVVGLRARYNERADFLFTTTPPVVEGSPTTSSQLLFPHLVNGGGYTTQFILFSGSSGQAGTGNLSFFAQDGTPLGLILN